MPQLLTDLDLINSTLAGNTSAYEVLLKRHQRFVFSLALRYTRNREEAEEVAQDVFVKAYRSLATFKQTAKFSTWLYTITYTTAMTCLRKKRLTITSLDDEEHVYQIATDDVDTAERKSSYRFLNEAITMLLPDDATIITLFYKGEQSLEEIGNILGVDPNTIKVKLHRARLRLKDKMKMILKDEVKELI